MSGTIVVVAFLIFVAFIVREWLQYRRDIKFLNKSKEEDKK